MYPTLSAFASINTGFSSAFPDQRKTVATPLPGFDTSRSAFVDVSGALKPILIPNFNYSTPNTPYFRQVFDARLGQAIGLNLSVPIFNNRQLRTNWERSKLNAENIKLQLEQDNLTLQTDIYTAYTNAVNAQQRYFAAMKTVEVSERAFDFSQKRYAAGLLQTIELITNQNNLYRSRLDALAAQYEYVFRMKLLEFYKGQGLKL
jgi:outer membrane protein